MWVKGTNRIGKFVIIQSLSIVHAPDNTSHSPKPLHTLRRPTLQTHSLPTIHTLKPGPTPHILTRQVQLIHLSRKLARSAYTVPLRTQDPVQSRVSSFSLQRHRKLPTLLTQRALTMQLWIFKEHSSTSEK